MSKNRWRPTCPQCGAELLLGTPPDQCPKCLLKAVLGTPPTAGPGGTVILPEPPTRSRGLPQPGEQLGHYQIVRLLGAGGMGAVFEAEDLDTGRRVALKVLSHSLDLPESRERFFREGRLAASINHPNSVYVFGTEEIAGTPVIAMELVAGGTLQDWVCSHGAFPVGEAVDAVLQIIAGLEAAQRIGILHRDVKPSNCYRAEDGTVKIGDFGLSISTTIRTEPALTASGTFVGTPAFCPPEQLRGDELNPRSDMYSVGATLFYVLTGQTPFEGKNSVQLLATVLEQAAPSPRKFRAAIPKGLARVVLRCLEKLPEHRFKSYGELTKALAPFSSAAPTPATLGFRALAGVIDLFLLTAVSTTLTWAALGNPLEFLSFVFQSPRTRLIWLGGWLAIPVLYYSVFESRLGATPGKIICRLRVVDKDRNAPAFWRAAFRAAMYVGVPVLPAWFFYGWKASLMSSMSAQTLLGFSYYILLGLLFSTVRRRNGFASMHDLASGIRVISRTALLARPVLTHPETAPTPAASEPAIGPYQVLESIEESHSVRWLLGYDLRLLRKVWIRLVPVGTPAVPASVRSIGRIGRLRWLTGRRSAEENWDAFEALTGKPFLHVIKTRQPWAQVRFWLFDLATELSAAEKDGTLPAIVALDRVWITADGRAKILDFTAPGVSAISTSSALSSESPNSQLTNAGERRQFFLEVAIAALTGNYRPTMDSTAATTPALRLPIHGRDFLKQLPQFADPTAIEVALKPLLQRPADVSRVRRAAILGGCAAMPLLTCAGMLLGMAMMRQWNRSRPGLMELNSLLQQHSTMSRWRKNPKAPSDQQFAIYVASHYAAIITNRSSWSDPFTVAVIRGKERDFAEQSVAEHPSPSPDQIADAEAALKPLIPSSDFFDWKKRLWLPVGTMGMMLLLGVGLPALIAAVAFRGGLLLRLAGVTFVRRDGSPASRLRLFWRAIVAWSPVALGVFCFAASLQRFGVSAASILSATVIGVLGLLSLIFPERGPQDRLAGTWPVPR